MPPKPTGQSDFELFRHLLTNMIDMKRDLVLLADRIDWSRFDAGWGKFYHDRKGRPGLPTRLMAGLHMLKHMEGISDEAICRQWRDNPYFQYFTGQQYFQHALPFDRSSMTRWRHRVGAKELELLLAETLRIAIEAKAMPEHAPERITVDSTVQTKAVAHPTDAHLLLRAIEHLNRAAKAAGVKVSQSYLRVARAARKEVARLFHNGAYKQAQRYLRKMRTWLGRLERDIGRKMEGNPVLAGSPALLVVLTTARDRAERVRTQKSSDKKKLYAMHAPEVECIGKGKARSKYEFGIKTSIAVTNARCKGGQFIVGMQTCPGNPYDGHTLSDQIAQVEKLTGCPVKRAYVDRGYRAHDYKGDGDVYISHLSKGITSPTIKRELRRRNAIEPIIGHTKSDGLLERNHLAGAHGDAINAILVAVGHNMRLLRAWFRALFCAIFRALFGYEPAPAC